MDYVAIRERSVASSRAASCPIRACCRCTPTRTSTGSATPRASRRAATRSPPRSPCSRARRRSASAGRSGQRPRALARGARAAPPAPPRARGHDEHGGASPDVGRHLLARGGAVGAHVEHRARRRPAARRALRPRAVLRAPRARPRPGAGPHRRRAAAARRDRVDARLLLLPALARAQRAVPRPDVGSARSRRASSSSAAARSNGCFRTSRGRTSTSAHDAGLAVGAASRSCSPRRRCVATSRPRRAGEGGFALAHSVPGDRATFWAVGDGATAARRRARS